MKATKKIIAVLFSLIFILSSLYVMASAETRKITGIAYDKHTHILSWDAPVNGVTAYKISLAKSENSSPLEFTADKTNCDIMCVELENARFAYFKITAWKNGDNVAQSTGLLDLSDNAHIDEIKITVNLNCVGKTMADYEEIVSIDTEGIEFEPDHANPVIITESDTGYYADKFENRIKRGSNYKFDILFSCDSGYSCDSLTKFYVNGKEADVIFTTNTYGDIVFVAKVGSGFFAAIAAFFANIANFFRNLFAPKK